MHLGREQRPHGPVGLPGGAHREQFIRDDGGLAGPQRLAGQDIPLTRPGISRIGRRPRRLTQIPARPGMILMAIAGQQYAAGRQPGAVIPHGILEKRRAGLRLANMKINAGTAGTPCPALPAGQNRAWRIARWHPFRANIHMQRKRAGRGHGQVVIDRIKRFCRDFRPDFKFFRRPYPEDRQNLASAGCNSGSPIGARAEARYVWA
jgi:hypothetical protein